MAGVVAPSTAGALIGLPGSQGGWLRTNRSRFLSEHLGNLGPMTPRLSRAPRPPLPTAELVSSLAFAAGRTTQRISVTFNQVRAEKAPPCCPVYVRSEPDPLVCMGC
jgi:hypothetical protein